MITAVSSIAVQMCQARNVQGAAAKAGVEAMIRVVAKEEARHGVRANALAIGLTDTDMARVAFDRWGPDTAERIVKGIPLGRIGTPEEVKDKVAEWEDTGVTTLLVSLHTPDEVRRVADLLA